MGNMPTIITSHILTSGTPETTEKQDAIILDALQIAIAYARMVNNPAAVKRFKAVQLVFAAKQIEAPF